MNSPAQKTPWIGQSVARLEDPPLVTGRGQFAGDINFPHQLFMRIVRSAHANGRITSIDAAAALALPGVFAVWTADDIADVPAVDFREGSIPALDPYRQPVLAKARVRYVGDPVAAVFAVDAYAAEDAADLVDVEIEELPALIDAQAAPVEFSPGHSSEAAVIRQGYGDVDAAFGQAAHIVELELAIGRHSGVPPSAAMTRRAACSNCMARPRFHIAIRNCWRACSACRRAPSTFTNRMSAAGSGSAANFIPRMCWSASRPSASAGR
jgi:carbon-monoxide dehydrogenase large subunit/6-hydroxypseudooxynicotine dehydrogenase subunit gamma